MLKSLDDSLITASYITQFPGINTKCDNFEMPGIELLEHSIGGAPCPAGSSSPVDSVEQQRVAEASRQAAVLGFQAWQALGAGVHL